MITITPIQSHQVTEAKYIVSGVAQRIFEPQKTVQEFYDILEQSDELHDMDNFQQIYFENRGLLLVILDGEKVIGTGGIKKFENEIAELKRIWLLEEFHGQKIGFRVVSQLLDFARMHDYEKVRLQTSKKQLQAIRFYTQFGFYKIPSFRESMDDISMEIKLYTKRGH